MYIQAGVHDFMRTAYDGHLRALREELAVRRKLANAAIARYWPPSLRADPNADGYYVWAGAPREFRARALLASAERLGVSFLFGEPFFAQGGGDHYIRLALTPVPRAAIEEGIARIGQVVTA
jgi:2-aminoadipate transaminase